MLFRSVSQSRYGKKKVREELTTCAIAMLITVIMAIKDYDSWDKSRLIEEVRRLSARKKYGLVWEDKPEDVVERCKTELPVLEEVEERAIESDPSLPTNFIIEGDNYHALSVLNYTHAGKVDVIYIDPPYNTGKENDFKYNDRWVDDEDAYKHSKWLSFIHKRLLLAKKLLAKDGVIFISIDDNENYNLRALCNEIIISIIVTGKQIGRAHV